MPQVKNAALLLCICAAPIACNDAPNSDPTEPEAAPDGPAVSAALATPLAFRLISAGGAEHTCGVTTQDVAYCWGLNTEGQLGDGTRTNRLKPVPVATSLRFRQLSAGYQYTCGVTTDFKAYCWGSNFLATDRAGQLGDGTTTRRLRPRAVLGGLEFREVSAGLAHTCGRTTTNRVYCWGGNTEGQVGNGSPSATPRLTPVPVGGSLRFRQVSVGNIHSCGVTPNDQAYCWGGNSGGQVGIGVKSSSVPTPTLVTGGHAFRTVDGGQFHTCGVTTDSQGFCWGDNLFGQLGIGETGGVRPRPRQVLGNLSFRRIEAGVGHNCGVTTLNVAHCWGSNQEGELGDGTRTHRSTPVAVLGGHRFRQVTAGGLFSCGVRTDATGYCWGENGVGSLGDGTTMDRTQPRAVAAPQ